jgi:predicted cupin superfamily sugar epimerase
MSERARELVRALGLVPHPEGGWFRETYRDSLTLPAAALPGHRGARSASTAILYLLEAGDFSALHRIASDELWHFHLGDPLVVHVLDPTTGRRSDLTLGPDVAAGHALQAVVPRGTVFGARLAPSGSFALVGCTVAPGFDFADFVMPSQSTLMKMFPAHAGLVGALTRVPPGSGDLA